MRRMVIAGFWWMAALSPAAARAQETATMDTPASGDALEEAFRLFALWLQSSWMVLAGSLLLLYVLAVLLTTLWGAGFRVRPIVAPPLGMLTAIPIWGALVTWYTLFRTEDSSAASYPWTFWLLMGLLLAAVLALPATSWLRRRAL